MGSRQLNLSKTAEKIANLVDKLLDYTEGKVSDTLSTKEDVDIHTKILAQSKDWFDKMINQQGNVTAIVDKLSPEDKDFIYRIQVGKAENKKGGNR